MKKTGKRFNNKIIGKVQVQDSLTRSRKRQKNASGNSEIFSERAKSTEGVSRKIPKRDELSQGSLVGLN